MRCWVWLSSTVTTDGSYQVGEFSQDVPPDTTAAVSGTQKSIVPQIAESHITTYQPAFVGPDDEERLFPEIGRW